MNLAAAHRTVGDVVQARHPTFAAVITAVICVAFALALVAAVAAVVSGGSALAWKIATAGASVGVAAALVLMAVAIATVFPGLGIATVGFTTAGVLLGLFLRRRPKSG